MCKVWDVECSSRTLLDRLTISFRSLDRYSTVSRRRSLSGLQVEDRSPWLKTLKVAELTKDRTKINCWKDALSVEHQAKTSVADRRLKGHDLVALMVLSFDGFTAVEYLSEFELCHLLVVYCYIANLRNNVDNPKTNQKNFRSILVQALQACDGNSDA